MEIKEPSESEIATFTVSIHWITEELRIILKIIFFIGIFNLGFLKIEDTFQCFLIVSNLLLHKDIYKGTFDFEGYVKWGKIILK